MNVVTQFPAARAYDRDLLFQAMFEGAAIGIGICRLDGGILEANPALSRMLGYSRQELAGAHARELCPELDRDISPGNSLPDERRADERRPDERRPDERWLGELMRGERDWFEVDKLCRRKDGSEFWGHLTVSLGHDGRRHFLITTLADATERKRVEERLGQAEKMEVIGRLAGGIAHDFNNLLTGILLYCDLLIAGLKSGVVENGVVEDGVVENIGLQNNELGNAALGSGRMEPGRLCQHVEGVRMAGEHGAALTQELLAIARKQAVEPRPVQINEVVASSKNLLRRLIGEQIELVVLLDPMLDPALDSGAGLVLADPAQLRQVVLNLVLNARDAVSQGGTITLSTRAAEFPSEVSKAVFTDALPPEGHVPQGLKPAFFRELDGTAEALHSSRRNPRLPGAPAVPHPKPIYEKSSGKAGPKNRRRAVSLVVSDNGCGMDRETRARLFEPFFTTKKPGQGTGLGLAMVQRIISEAGGTIEVESEPGHGTRMAVFFPAIESLVEGPAVARTHSS
jgi:signal transduction histidine kinase